MAKQYLDKSYIKNPFSEYLRWLFIKLKYQWAYKGKSIRIGYMSQIYDCEFESNSWTGNNVLLQNVRVGRFTYFSDNSVILNSRFGRFCSIGPNVRVAPGNHPTRVIVSTHPAIYSNPSYCIKNFSDEDKHNPPRHVEVGNDVWICANAVINDNVKIGDGAIVAANSVVIKDVEPYSIVGGVPAKHLRFRFEDHQREILLREKWWLKDISWIEENTSLLWDIEVFTSFFNDKR